MNAALFAGGLVIGAVIATAGVLARSWWESRPEDAMDEPMTLRESGLL